MAGTGIAHLVVDPHVFLVPRHPSKAAGLEYVLRLMRWCRFLKRIRGYCSTPSALVNHFLQFSLFPSLNTLKALVGDVEFVSVQDLRNALRVISDLQPFTEDFSGVVDVDFVGPVSLMPEVYVDRMPETSRDLFTRSLFSAVFAAEQNWAVEHLLFGTNLVAEESRILRVAGNVGLFADTSGAVHGCCVSVDRQLPICDDPVQICKHLKIEMVYSDPEIATYTALLQAEHDTSFDWEQLSVRADPGFVASIDDHGIASQPSVLRRLYFLAAMALLGRLHEIEGAKVHPVREGRAADSPQVERADGAKLWRCMLTKEGAGYRLHYWSPVCAGIELVAVMRESEV